uniref:Uncharacterized protein n=1 Tax=Clastoptera arizonana TaxID=38151 RepID=A0A1B6D028_9HEMI
MIFDGLFYAYCEHCNCNSFKNSSKCKGLSKQQFDCFIAQRINDKICICKNNRPNHQKPQEQRHTQNGTLQKNSIMKKIEQKEVSHRTDSCYKTTETNDQNNLKQKHINIQNLKGNLTPLPRKIEANKSFNEKLQQICAINKFLESSYPEVRQDYMDLCLRKIMATPCSSVEFINNRDQPLNSKSKIEINYINKPYQENTKKIKSLCENDEFNSDSSQTLFIISKTSMELLKNLDYRLTRLENIQNNQQRLYTNNGKGDAQN